MKKILFLGIFVTLFIFSSPVQAEEAPTSTPEIPEETPTSTEEIVTPTSTLKIETPTTTPTSTEEIILPTSTIYIQIETIDGNLFSDYFTFTACPNAENSDEYTLNAWCAIQQLAEKENWTIGYSWSSYGLYLSQINQYDGNDHNWWGWYSELEMGGSSLNSHLTTENENLLLTYGVSPLKIDISNLEPEINSTTTIQIQEFGFDSSWNSIWLDSTSSTLSINNEEFITDNGSYELLITTTTPYEIFGKKNGFINTKTNIINPKETEEENNNGGSSSSEIQNISISDTEINNTISKILDYLRSQQDETGKISDGTITDWVIMSFASKEIYADDVTNNSDSLLDYEKKYNLDDSSDLNVCASYPRHILALLSAGVGKNDNAILGLQNKIMTECYKDNLYGQDGINDDVFGLLALLAIGTNKDEIIIQDIVNTIKADQTADGAFTWSGWAGADMTGVAINSLKYAQTKNVEIDNKIFTNAKNYLKNQQLPDGGWGYGSSDIMTTSWVLMGINAIGETQSDWFNSAGKNPWYPFIEQINETGFYESAWVPGSVDWFAMKHAVPALANKSWPIILPEKVQNFFSGGGLNYIYSPTKEIITTTTEDLVTTTLDIATTTLEISTTTLEIVTTTLEVVTTTLENLEIPTSTEIIIDISNTTSSNNSNTSTPNISTPKYQKPTIISTSTPILEIIPTSTEIISSTTENTAEETAKKVFATSAGMGGSLLIYLIWKIIKGLV